MQFDFIENDHERRAFAFSLGVVALSVVSVIIFVLTGGSLIFYLFAALAIVLGFYMAWHISRPPAEAQPAARKRTGRQ